MVRRAKTCFASLRQFLPQLQPDLVFYGANHNDFLPSQVGQYIGRGFEVPIPDTWKSFFLARSRFARFMSDAYDATPAIPDEPRDPVTNATSPLPWCNHACENSPCT